MKKRIINILLNYFKTHELIINLRLDDETVNSLEVVDNELYANYWIGDLEFQSKFSELDINSQRIILSEIQNLMEEED